MRILHVIPSIAPRYGGPSQAINGMCQALRKRGLDVLVVSTDADGPGRLDVPVGELTPYQGLPTLFFPRQWSEAVKYSRPLAHWLNAHVNEFSVVHIHAVFSHACLAAARACQRTSVPYVVRPLGTLDPWSMAQKPWRKQLFLALGARHMLQRAAAIHYTASEERRLAETWLGPGHGVVIPLGVSERLLSGASDPGAFRRRFPETEDDPYVLVLSRLHPKKGLDVFLDVFAQATRDSSRQRWRLVLAGDGEPDYVDSLKEHAARLGLGRRVLFAEWVSGSEKDAVVAGAELLALPSQQENFGLAVVEAMARAVPVLLSTEVNLAPDVIKWNAGWVTPLAPEMQVRALDHALADAEERRRRGAAGRQFVAERLTWDSVAEQMENLYRQVAAGSLRAAVC